MTPDPAISSVAHTIQLAVAPVFLLMGIGGFLGVMTTRLARSIDRARVVADRVAAEPQLEVEYRAEIAILSRRARLIGWSIGLCTLAALFVATLVAILFLGAYVPFEASGVVVLLFVSAMVSLIAALLLFLREIHLAASSLRLGGR